MVVNKNLSVSCFEMIGPAMIGPSSSHTAGACRLGYWAQRICGQRVTEARFTLYGSFAQTWRGHGTDRALLAGVMGMNVDDPRLRDAYRIAEENGLHFHFARDTATVTAHPNTVKIELLGEGGKAVSVVGESIGGGRAKVIQIDGIAVKFNGRLNSMLIYQKDRPGILAHIAQCCAKRKINIAFLNLFRSDRENDAFTLVETDNVIPDDLIRELEAHELVRQVMILENNVFSLDEQPEAISEGKAEEDEYASEHDRQYMFASASELLSLCEQSSCSIAEVMIRREMYLSGNSRREIFANMTQLWHVMQASIEEPLSEVRKSMGGLIGGEGKKVLESLQSKPALLGNASRAVAYALAVLEQNAAMGLIVAAPTAGASGILPACLKAYAESYECTEEKVTEALFVAAALAYLIQLGFTHSGAEGGCQAEVGSAAAMAASALAYLTDCPREAQLDAASISMMNLLGLVCDPVAGLVELPCQLRNANGAVTAFASAQMVMAGIRSILPLDEMINVCQKVGSCLPASLRETAQGGVAAAPSALRCASCLFH